MLNLSDLPAPVHALKLPTLLEEILRLLPSEEDEKRFRSLFSAAATSMSALGEFDLTRFESDDEGSEDAYQTWDEIAPVVSHTLDAVHQLLTVVNEEFPQCPKALSTQADTACALLVDFSEKLGQEVVGFRDGARKPENMIDRWRLLAYLTFFRGRLRASIGDMIFGTASVFANVHKSDVVPFYMDEMECAITLRRGLGELRKTARLDDWSKGGMKGDSERVFAANLLSCLEAFSKEEAYRFLRVPDRRVFVGTISVLRKAFGGTPDTGGLSEALERFAAFMGTLANLNEREALVFHDQKVADVAVESIANAKEAVRTGLLRARIEMQSALHSVARLQGRDPEIDAVLETMNPHTVDSMDLATLMAHIERLDAVLTNLRRQRQDDENAE